MSTNSLPLNLTITPLERHQSASKTLSESSGGRGLVKHRMPFLALQFFDSLSLCIAKKFPGDADDASLLLLIHLYHCPNHTVLSFLMSLTVLPVI